jgi:TP901 family phage tail tape measure protein
MAVIASEYAAIFTADTRGFEKGVGRTRDELGRFVKGTDGANKSLSGLGSNFGRTGGSVLSFGNAFKTVSGLLLGGAGLGALVAVGKQILTIGIDYEKSMNVFQIATRASTDEMARAAQVAQALGADMTLPATSAANAAVAMTELAKSGLTATQAMDAAKGVLQLAAAATISEAQAAEIAGTALNAFHLEAKEAGRVSDLLAAASMAASGEITDMAMGMQQSATVAASFGIPIEDLSTALTLMAKNALKGSDAGTSLKTFLNSLTPTTKAAAKAMSDLGIDAFDARGKFVGLEAIIRQAQPALSKMTDEQARYAIKLAFGSDAQRAANILLGAGTEGFGKLKDAVTVAGAAQELAAAKSKGLGGAIDGVKSQLETLALKIYERVSPSLEEAARKTGEWLTLLSSGQWGTALDQLFGNIGNGFAKLQEQMNQGMDSTLASQKAFGLVLESIWHTTWQNIGNNLKSDWEFIKGLLRSEWEDLVNTMRSVLGPNMEDVAREAGRKSVGAFKVGIEMKSPSAFQKIMTAIMMDLPLIIRRPGM